MASLKVSGADKIFPSGSLALYDINFEAKDKEFLVVLGGEASGKSTLLRVIAGLEDCSDGKIFIGDKDMTEAAPKDRELAMIFRTDSLSPALNVFDNMAFGLKMRKAPQALIEQRVKATAAILGLSDLLYRRTKSLTAAQKQCVAIGRAIVREPRLYLFDEPLSGLDDKLKAEILNVIINLQARVQGTFVYATKNVAEAMTIGTRIIVLKNGIVQQIDTPANLYDYPANTYVAFFIGAPTINFVNNAKIVKTDDGVFAEQGGFRLKLSETVLSRFSSLDKYAGADKNVIIGIRPEDARVAAEGMDAVVTKTESDGDRHFAECVAGEQSLVVTADEKTEKGAKTKLYINCDRLYLFDAETRLTLLSRDGGYTQTGFTDADYKPLPYKEEEEIKEKFKPKKDVKKKR